jgi:lipopolysaccharide transport system ATP-binding protein
LALPGFKRLERVLLMFSDIAIRVENLSKCYHIYNQPHDRLKQWIYPRFQRLLGKQPKQYFREFWALKNVSFEIKKGETVGIIGRNGSGKSTLLQMICGTLSPTSGSVHTSGRIAALLELGSGFNPEFTGRENVYMNAAVLGLTRTEIDDRFNAIVSFADIGDFLEQPVKTYSSGMMVRLAFAVTVHVNADILIVDEALAVGDAFFTQKCMLKIKELMSTGVTLLFVSHDSSAVKSLCNGAILLDHCELICFGDTNSVVEAYYSNFIKQQQETLDAKSIVVNSIGKEKITEVSLKNNNLFHSRAEFQRINNGKASFLNVQLLNELGQEIQEADFGQLVTLRMIFRTHRALPLLGLAYHIRDKNGFDLVYSDTGIDRCPVINTKAGEEYALDWQFNVMLNKGNYTIAAMLSIPQDLTIGHVEVCDFVPIAVQLKVNQGDALPIYGAVYWKNKAACNKITTQSTDI